MRIEKEKLKDLASRLKFRMSEEEYDLLQEEFEVILSQMELIGEIENADTVEPLAFPFMFESVGLREDEIDNVLSPEDVIKNAKDSVDGLIKVKKVVQ
jgi:aspartyl/glutamyl-tRNA(Asn/Gln) amidotransferase C subunit